MCAAVAVSNLNANATNLRDVEDSRDQSVTTAGMVVGVALVSMLIEGVITAMHFYTKDGVIAFVVSQSQSRQSDFRQKNSFVIAENYCFLFTLF